MMTRLTGRAEKMYWTIVLIGVILIPSAVELFRMTPVCEGCSVPALPSVEDNPTSEKRSGSNPYLIHGDLASRVSASTSPIMQNFNDWKAADFLQQMRSELTPSLHRGGSTNRRRPLLYTAQRGPARSSVSVSCVARALSCGVLLGEMGSKVAPPDQKPNEAVVAAAKLADITLPTGHVVKERWRVLEKLGEGGFGAVYKVVDGETKEEYALKLESKKEEDSMVQVEAVVMKQLVKLKLGQHSCQFHDEGETPVFRYVVMQLLGKSLSDLRKTCMSERFSMSTTVRLGVQSLEAIEALHKIGFLHRDIKPSNFAMGRSDKDKRTVFMLDYGLCRQYISRDGQLRPPRKMAGFRGTVRYASINAHLRKELGRHDDLWCLYYMLVECRSGGLPWRKIADKDEVMKKKQETTVRQLLYCIEEPEFERMFESLQRLQYADTPNYVWFHMQLKSIALRNRFLENQPFDWEPGGESFEYMGVSAPEKPKKKKKKEKEKEKEPGDDKTGEPKK